MGRKDDTEEEPEKGWRWVPKLIYTLRPMGKIMSDFAGRIK